jgi:hypothetical protein
VKSTATIAADWHDGQAGKFQDWMFRNYFRFPGIADKAGLAAGSIRSEMTEAV